jgi:hypothetical protein
LVIVLRESALITFVALASLLLVGCEQVLEETGSAGIRRDGTDLLIATCDPLSVEQFAVSARSRSQALAKPVRVVTLEGSAHLEAGHIYRVGDEIAGLKIVDLNSVDLGDLKDISIEIASPSPPYNALFWVWNLERDSIPEGAWLMSNGSTGPDPCSAGGRER